MITPTHLSTPVQPLGSPAGDGQKVERGEHHSHTLASSKRGMLAPGASPDAMSPPPVNARLPQDEFKPRDARPHSLLQEQEQDTAAEAERTQAQQKEEEEEQLMLLMEQEGAPSQRMVVESQVLGSSPEESVTLRRHFMEIVDSDGKVILKQPKMVDAIPNTPEAVDEALALKAAATLMIL